MTNSNPNQEEDIKFTWSTIGDGTPGGEEMKKIFMDVIKERAAEGYIIEQQYLNRRTEFEV